MSEAAIIFVDDLQPISVSIRYLFIIEKSKTGCFFMLERTEEQNTSNECLS